LRPGSLWGVDIGQTLGSMTDLAAPEWPSYFKQNRDQEDRSARGTEHVTIEASRSRLACPCSPFSQLGHRCVRFTSHISSSLTRMMIRNKTNSQKHRKEEKRKRNRFLVESSVTPQNTLDIKHLFTCHAQNNLFLYLWRKGALLSLWGKSPATLDFCVDATNPASPRTSLFLRPVCWKVREGFDCTGSLIWLPQWRAWDG